MKIFRYSEWDGSQEDEGQDVDGLMDQLGRNLMASGDLAYSLRAMQQRGFLDGQGQFTPSIQDMLERLRLRKHEQLSQYNLDDIMGDIREKLDAIIRTEREGIQSRLVEAREKAGDTDVDLDSDVLERLVKTIEDRSRQNIAKLDGLPKDAGGRIKGLTDYDFMDDQARRMFKELLELLKERAMQSYGKDLLNQARNLDPESLARMRFMIEALNQMLEQRLKGEDYDFDGFMREFGDFFSPNPPENLDELIERMQQQIAQTQSLMNSLSPKDRAELQKILGSMVDDVTQFEMSKLSSYLDRLFPIDQIQQRYPFSGDESIPYHEAMKLMEELQKMDRLETQLRDSRFDRNLDNVDPELVKDMLGEESAEGLEQLKEMTRRLEEAGYIRPEGDQYELTPRGMRKIGEQALKDVFSQLTKDQLGNHKLKMTGIGGDRTEETRPYEFGDDLNLHLQKTIMNAIQRQPGQPPVRLTPADFEVYQREEMTRSATILLLDMSLSMPMRGNFEAAKRVTLALDGLIRSQYPRDTLRIVGFSSYGRELKKENLAYMSWDEFDPYTNLQHGLSVARKMLDRERANNRQIILVTDGEPTAHFENGQFYYHIPPSLRTLQMTMREVRNCTRKGIVINTFMLESDPRENMLSQRDEEGGSVFRNQFVERIARLNKGRVFFTSPDRLGEYLLVDFISNRRKKY